MTPRERVICPDCGLAQRLPVIPPRQAAHCPRCGKLLARATAHLQTPLALTLAALLLWTPACLAPLMTVIIAGAERSTNLAGCIKGLWATGYPALATVVAVLMLAVPSAYLAMMVLVLISARSRTGASSAWSRGMLRAAGWLRPWLMTDVFVIGGCVAYTRIETVASLQLGIGTGCLIGSALLLLTSEAVIDERALWRRLHATAETAAGRRQRSRASLQGVTALVFAGLLLYVPANLLPIVTLERYGSQESNTILGGVRELIRNDLWPLAVIVFVASIVIPFAKLCGLCWMLWLTRRRSRRFLVGRTRTYRLIEAVGRWSNIDVFMISLLVALVQFGALTRVRAQSGAIAFAAVVIITMIASQIFDPRLMWDAAADHGERQP